MEAHAPVAYDLMRKAALQNLASMIQPLLCVAHPVQYLVRECARAAIEPPLKIGNIGYDQFSRSTRRGRAQVRDKIANGEIDFMANCRHNRQGRMEYRACDNLFVEFPQILNASAAARDH